MSEPENPYDAPAAELVSASTGNGGGSIENTLAGDADLDISEVMSQAWELSGGVRSIVLIAGVVAVLIAVFLAGFLGLFFGSQGQSFVASQLVQMLTTVAIYPIWAGIFMVALRHAVNLPVELNMAFGYYGMIVQIAIIGILQSVATTIGMVLLVLPGIYLAIALSLAIPLKVDKDLPVLDCLMTSLKLVNAKFVNVAVLAILASLGAFVGFITIIGWIWTIPWVVMVYAITYRQLAGASLIEQD